METCQAHKIWVWIHPQPPYMFRFCAKILSNFFQYPEKRNPSFVLFMCAKINPLLETEIALSKSSIFTLVDFHGIANILSFLAYIFPTLCDGSIG